MNEIFFESIAKHAQRGPRTVAILSSGRNSLTYRCLANQIQNIANSLRNHGVSRDDRVMILMPHSPELAILTLSIMSCAVVVPLNPDAKPSELIHIIEKLKPSMLVMEAQSNHSMRGIAVAKSIPIAEVELSNKEDFSKFGLSFNEVPRKSVAMELSGPNDLAIMLQTSGTTSYPKIVPLTHKNLMESANNIKLTLGLKPQDKVLHFLPMFHIGGIVDVLMAPLLSGGEVICNSGFSVQNFYRDLAFFKPTWIQAVPVMLKAILDEKHVYQEIIDNSSLNFVRSVSAPLPSDLMKNFGRELGVPIIEIYGMTETSGVITSNPLPPSIRRVGSVGIPAPNMCVKILDEFNNQSTVNQIGSVVVKGPSLLKGYLFDEDENARVIKSHGFYTGDLGYLDEDGYLYLTGRVKDIINRGGEKVTPQEVDRVLLEHPSILDAAVFPIPHPSLGEDVGAVVVLREGVNIPTEDILSWLRERLAYFKIPQKIFVIDEIPRKNGKLQRSYLSDLYGKLNTANTSRSEYIAPNTPVAKVLERIWSRVLKINDIGMDDDFFLLGGDSLRAASLINELQEEYGDAIYVSSIFEAPTLRLYEKYLSINYPQMSARMLGKLVTQKNIITSKVTEEMIAQIDKIIPRPLSSSFFSKKKNSSAVFILTTPRSGSTLFRSMLAGNAKLFAPPELYLLSYENLADRRSNFLGSQSSQLEGNIRALMELRGESPEKCQSYMELLEEKECSTQEYYALLQELLGDRILVDKTPAYSIDINALKRAENYFDNPFYIHLQRHPYGMIRSFEEIRLEQLWFKRILDAESYDVNKLPFSGRNLAEIIWYLMHRNILQFLEDIPNNRKLTLRFEDVVRDPQATMHEVCNSLAIDFDLGMLNPKDKKKQLMTDGIHDLSRMIGDPKFHSFDKIESSVADQWKKAYEVDFLCEQTFELARSMGYMENLNSIRGRTEIEI